MRHRTSSSASGSGRQEAANEGVDNVRTRPPHTYDNITRRLLQLGVTLGITTFIGLIVRYAVQEFDPSVSTITVTTARVNNRDVASLSVSKNFLERILEFVAESISIVAVIIPLGFPLCTIFNRYLAKVRAGTKKFEIRTPQVLSSMIPKYLIIGDSLACLQPANGADQLSTTTPTGSQLLLRPLLRDTIYHLIRARLKPKLIVEDSYEEARKLGIRIGLIKREHHKLAVIKSVDLMRNITDSRGDIKPARVRHLLARMKIMSQATPADKSLLIYLIKFCESQPNENLAYLGHTFTDPEAMRLADCALTFDDCDDDDVKQAAHVILKSPQYSSHHHKHANSNTGDSSASSSGAHTFPNLYLFLIVCLISSNITQSYALYQQVFAICALMTKWISSLPAARMRPTAAGMAQELTTPTASKNHHHHHHQQLDASFGSLARNSSRGQSSTTTTTNNNNNNHHDHNQTVIQMHARDHRDDTLGSSTSLDIDDLATGTADLQPAIGEHDEDDDDDNGHRSPGGAAAAAAADPQDHRKRRGTPTRGRRRRGARQRAAPASANADNRQTAEQAVHLSGVDFDLSVINSKVATNYKQTFHNSSLIDDVTYRLAKLHIAYQILVMIIIMIFGNAMFQLNTNNNRQHQTLAFNSLLMNNILNLANCFNQFGEFNLSSGFRNHPFFLCVLLFAIALQVCLTELNAFGLENLNPSQWFVCFVFGLMSALIAPLTGQQRSLRHQQQAHKLGLVNTVNVGGGGGGGASARQQQQQQQQARASQAYLSSANYI